MTRNGESGCPGEVSRLFTELATFEIAERVPWDAYRLEPTGRLHQKRSVVSSWVRRRRACGSSHSATRLGDESNYGRASRERPPQTVHGGQRSLDIPDSARSPGAAG